jgi:hypothetical protein
MKPVESEIISGSLGVCSFMGEGLVKERCDD